MALFSLLEASATLLAGDWRDLTRLPCGVAGSGLAATVNDLWIAGGSYWQAGEKKMGREIWRWRRDSHTWEIAATLPAGFGHGGSAAEGHYLWLAGGFSDGGPSDRVWRFDCVTATAVEFARLPSPRAYCGAAVLDGALWIVGGTAVDGDFSHAATSLVRVDLADGRVSVEATDGPPLINPLVLSLNGELHVLPGGVWSPEQNRLVAPSAISIYSPAQRQWRKRWLATMPPRGLSGAALGRGHALVAGGIAALPGKAVLSASAWIYEADGSTFTATAPLPAARLAAAIACDGRSVIIAGGEDGTKSRADSVWEWTALPSIARDGRK